MKTDPNTVLAKSKPEISLQEHIEDCLKAFTCIQHILPALPKIAQKENFWDLLFSAVYLHDWGKSHSEFQKVLRREPNHRWNSQRHELYSTVFVETLDFNDSDKLLIKRSILGHHKDFKDLKELWVPLEEIQEWERNQIAKSSCKHKHDFPDNLKKLKSNYPTLQHLQSIWHSLYKKHCSTGTKKFTFSAINLNFPDHPYVTVAKATILEQNSSSEKWKPENSYYWKNFLLWGATKICDHLGSARMGTLSILQDEDFQFLNCYRSDGGYSHQRQLAQTPGNCILIAPTGTGKTEAALFWLQKQLSRGQGRAWYILPYTASINAMYSRLQDPEKGFSSAQQVSLFHGKADLFFSSIFANRNDKQGDSSSVFDQEVLYKLREHDGLYFPLRIVTPFQILKWFYTVQGFEKGITQLAGAKLIFDEIHAYDARTFAQLLICLEWMQKYLHVQILIMTATLPSFMMERLKNSLGGPSLIHADQQLKDQLKRHLVAICEGSIEEQIDAIRECLADGKRVIIVCNTVEKAQMVFNEFDEIVCKTLLHSRFIFTDRQKNETELQKKENKLLIGTQAIEVSLDIDYDVLFTEPAPLDALLQRFGRINRKPPHKIIEPYPAFVCTQGGEYDHFIYDRELVQNTLNELQNVIDFEEGVISENNLQDHLDAVYPNWTDSQKKEFEESTVYFEHQLTRLQPFRKNKEDEAAFYEQFTGIQVVPIIYFEDYKRHIHNFDFTESEKLVVGITRGMYQKLDREGKIEKVSISFLKKTENKEKVHNFYVLVASCYYDPALGLTNEHDTSMSIGENFM